MVLLGLWAPRLASASVAEFLAHCLPSFGDLPGLTSRMAASGMRPLGPDDTPRLSDLFPNQTVRLAWRAPPRPGEIDAFVGFSVGTAMGVTTEACWSLRRPEPGFAEASATLQRLQPPAPNGVRRGSDLFGDREEWNFTLDGTDAVLGVRGSAAPWSRPGGSFLYIFRIRPASSPRGT